MIFTCLYPDPENVVPEIYYLLFHFYCAIIELWIENTVAISQMWQLKDIDRWMHSFLTTNIWKLILHLQQNGSLVAALHCFLKFLIVINRHL